VTPTATPTITPNNKDLNIHNYAKKMVTPISKSSKASNIKKSNSDLKLLYRNYSEISPYKNNPLTYLNKIDSI